MSHDELRRQRLREIAEEVKATESEWSIQQSMGGSDKDLLVTFGLALLFVAVLVAQLWLGGSQ